MTRRSFIRWTAAALALACGQAMADPVTLITVGAYFLAGAKVAFAISVIAGIYGSMDARRKAKHAEADARRAYNAALQDRTATMLQASPPLRVVYGRCRTGGDIVAEFTTNKTGYTDAGRVRVKPDGLKHLVIVVAAHEVQNIHDVYINGIAVGTTDASGWAFGGPEDAPWGRKRRLVVSTDQAVQFDASGRFSFNPLDRPGVTVTAVLYAGTDPDFQGGTQYELTITDGLILSGAPANAQLHLRCEFEFAESCIAWRKHLGTDGQSADSYLMSIVPAQWTSAHRLAGLAYVVVTLDLEDARFQGGPPQMDFDVSGRLLLDPATGTTGWSDNAALVVHDYLRAPWGFNCPAGDVDTAATIAASAICAQQIALVVGAETSTGSRYTINGVVTSADGRESVLDDMCSAMSGGAHHGATWRIYAGGWSDPVMDLTDDDMTGPVQIVQAAVGLEDAFNGMRGTYIPAGTASPADIEPYSNAVFVAADGAALWTDMQLLFTDNKARAKNLCRIRVESNRLGMVMQYPARLRAWPLQVNDRVRVTNAGYGWVAKHFRVTDWEYSTGRSVMLTLQEDEPSAWDDADAAVADPAPNTVLSNPWAVSMPANVAAASGTAHLLQLADGTIIPRVQVTWSAPTSAHMLGPGSATEVRWTLDGESWQVQRTSTDALAAYLIGMVEGLSIIVGVRHINAMGIDSAWVHKVHFVVGESAPPGNVTGFTATVARGQVVLAWDHCADLDYRETEIRIGVDWETGGPIFIGAAATFNWPVELPGAYTLWAVHRDRTGHSSTGPVSATVTVAAADLAAATNWDVEIESVNGTEFRPGQGTQTMLIAHVFRNGVDVTSSTPASQFRWRRVSLFEAPPPADDATWNALYATGYKQVLVSVDDVASKATFHCDILDS